MASRAARVGGIRIVERCGVVGTSASAGPPLCRRAGDPEGMSVGIGGKSAGSLSPEWGLGARLLLPSSSRGLGCGGPGRTLSGAMGGGGVLSFPSAVTVPSSSLSEAEAVVGLRKSNEPAGREDGPHARFGAAADSDLFILVGDLGVIGRITPRPLGDLGAEHCSLRLLGNLNVLDWC